MLERRENYGEISPRVAYEHGGVANFDADILAV